MRVGYVLKRYPRYSETFIVNEILAHESAGMEVEIFALRHPNDEHFQDSIARVRAPVSYLAAADLGVSRFWSELDRVSRVPGGAGFVGSARGERAQEVYQAMRLARAVAERGIDHLHAHFATSAAAVARLAAHLASVPYTFTTHAKDIFHESVDADDYRRKLEEAAGVVTVSDYNLRYLRERYGGAASHVKRVYNGMHLDRFSYTSPADRPRSIVAVGRLVEKKGFGDLITACKILLDRGCEFACRIVGGGELREALAAQVVDLGLTEQVVLTGSRPQDEVITLIRNAAVFAAPCVVGGDGNRDGLPTVLLEAMALGTPCVSTDVTGIPEVVRDGDTGLMIGQGDPASLAGALEGLLGGADARVRLAENARRLIEAEFDIHTNAARLRALFESVAEPALPRAAGASS